MCLYESSAGLIHETLGGKSEFVQGSKSVIVKGRFKKHVELWKSFWRRILLSTQ